VTVLASHAYLGESRADRVAADARWASLFVGNFRFIQQGIVYLDAQLPPSPLQHSWSLAVEEQLHALWPALMMLVALIFKNVPPRLKLAPALTGIIGGSLLWSIHRTAIDGTTAYFSPLPWACELGAGALLAVVVPWLLPVPRRAGWIMSWCGIGIIVAAGVLFDATTRFPGDALPSPWSERSSPSRAGRSRRVQARS
jgi:peptidoglycan/LPS O-acetylase OafA/YrhL